MLETLWSQAITPPTLPAVMSIHCHCCSPRLLAATKKLFLECFDASRWSLGGMGSADSEEMVAVYGFIEVLLLALFIVIEVVTGPKR